MAHNWYTNDGAQHNSSSVKLPADPTGATSVEYLADNEVTKNDKIQQTKSVTLTASGTVNPDAGYDAVRSVSVTVQGGSQVNVQPVKTITISSSGRISPDAGYDAMGAVDVTVQGGSDPVPVNIAVSAAGVVTASGAGIVTGTHQLSASDDADFVAANIKSGVTIFGRTGTYNPSSGNVTLSASISTSTYPVGTALSAIKDNVEAVLHFPSGATYSVDDASLVTLENVTTGGTTIANGSNTIRVTVGGITTTITVTGQQSGDAETYTRDLVAGTTASDTDHDYRPGIPSPETETHYSSHKMYINPPSGMTNEPIFVDVYTEDNHTTEGRAIYRETFEKQGGSWVCTWLSVQNDPTTNLVDGTHTIGQSPAITVDSDSTGLYAKITNLGENGGKGYVFSAAVTYKMTVSDSIPNE